MRIDEVELRIVRLPYRSPFRTSFGEDVEKHATIVTVRSEGVEGYGEGVFDPFPMYREETIAGAHQLLRAAFAPDLVVLDVMLPVIDGLEVCRRLRRAPAHAAAKILFLTARGRAHADEHVLEAGADACMTKPFATQELLARVSDLLGD